VSTLVPPVAGDAPLSGALHIPRERRIASPYRRACAFVADTVFIGIAANILAWPFFYPLSHLGVWGPVLGFFLALPYFAISNSRIGNGQTPGKRLLKVQVVDGDGSTLSFADSVLRYTIFAIPYYLADVAFSSMRTPVASAVFWVITTGMGVSTIYLMCFNRRTRQGLHDLAVNSFVVEAHKSDPLNPKPIWKMHWVILGAILVACLSGGVVAYLKISQWEPFSELLKDVKLLEGMPGVYGIGAQRFWASQGEASLIISVQWTGNSYDDEALSDDVAKKILEGDHAVAQLGVLRIVVSHGFNIGIANAHVSQAFQHTPAEWRERLGLAPLAEPPGTKP